MPLKKVDNFSSRMTYAVEWEYPDFSKFWLCYQAIGVKTVGGELEVVRGTLCSSDPLEKLLEELHVPDTVSVSTRKAKDWFISNYDTCYGISWEAKLSGEDDIKLAKSHSFAEYETWYDVLSRYREELVARGTVLSANFEGWYVNA